MLVRAGAVWLAIMLIAILNGAARDILLVPRLGDLVARALSCLTLATLIVVVTWVSLRWIHPASLGDAWTIGVMWLAMTLTFELLPATICFTRNGPRCWLTTTFSQRDCGSSCSLPQPSHRPRLPRWGDSPPRHGNFLTGT
jgi:hypothetical protein